VSDHKYVPLGDQRPELSAAAHTGFPVNDRRIDRSVAESRPYSRSIENRSDRDPRAPAAARSTSQGISKSGTTGRNPVLPLRYRGGERV